MNERLYRFRPVDTLLGDRKELEKQTVYFAAPSQLNDPMEGFRDIYWAGDEIVWKALVKNYLVCLERVYAICILNGEDHPFDPIDIAPLWSQDFVTPAHEELLNEIFNAFKKELDILSYIKKIAASSRQIRRVELSLHLDAIHPFALSVIHDCFVRKGLTSSRSFSTEELRNIGRSRLTTFSTMLDQIEALEKKDAEKRPSAEHLFEILQRHLAQIDLIAIYNKQIDDEKKNKNLLFMYFPGKYLRAIEEVIYPSWYTACFMSNCSDSAVWGHYGGSHKEVCLIFSTKEHNGKKFLKLKGQIGLGGSGPIVDFRDYEFLPISYSHDYVAVDFFQSLGRFNIAHLRKFWYTGDDGQLSACANTVFGSEATWRQGYWDRFIRGVTTKLDAWRYESEYRLVLVGNLLDFSIPQNRTLNYEFSDLEGIIFGIETPQEKKLAISRVIEEKCRAVGRKDFKFYQAFYSREKACIDHYELRFLKFS